jgi:hypothetical protein
MAVRQSAIDLVKSKGFVNVETMAQVADELGFEFAATVALFDMESKGKNIYGSDYHGTFAGKGAVTKANFKEFYHLVVDLKKPSNGVGPAQITWRGFFPDMAKQGLKAWDVHDNMYYGVKLLKSHYAAKKTWVGAGTAYNGKLSYGLTFAARRLKWRALFLADATKNK